MISRPLSLAIVGATGAVGREFLTILEQRKTPVAKIKLYSSPRSAGTELTFRGERVRVEALEDARLARGAFSGCDAVLLSAGASVSRKAVPAAVRDGAIAIDNSSAYREDPEIPLVIPEINATRISGHGGIIANPNCTAAVLLMAVAPLHRESRARRIVVSSYQAVSGKGAQAMAECIEQTRELLSSKTLDRSRMSDPKVFPRPIAFNLLPHIDTFESDGRTREEIKIERESRKILEDGALRVDATCVRVPVLRCHSESVNVEFERPIAPEDARKLWQAAAGIVVMDDPASGVYPTPLDAEGRDEVFVGRARRSQVFDGGLAFWCVGDQLRKGAALNAIQILESCNF